MHEWLAQLHRGEALHDAVISLIAMGRRSPACKEALLHELEDCIRAQSVIYQVPAGGLEPDHQALYDQIRKASVIQRAAILTVLGVTSPDELLDQKRWLESIDASGMLCRLEAWPAHIQHMRDEALRAAQKYLERHRDTPDRVVIYGLGGSGAPHDIAAEMIANWHCCGIPIHIIRVDTPNTDLITPQTLVIAASFSGNTEETVACYHAAAQRTDRIVIIAKGGEMLRLAKQDDRIAMQLPDSPQQAAFVLQPRESVCLQSTATLCFLAVLALPPGSAGAWGLDRMDFTNMETLLLHWRKAWGADCPFAQNQAKQMAFFLLYGFPYEEDKRGFDVFDTRTPYLLGDYNLQALVHEAATQFRERSKLHVVEGILPEDLHNTVEAMRLSIDSAQWGLEKERMVYYFLDSEEAQARISIRAKITRQVVMDQAASYAVVEAQGKTPYERAMYLTYFNAFVTTYAALLHGADPLPVPTMSWLKNVLAGIPRDSHREKMEGGIQKQYKTV